ncbi:hypothetical protein ABDD95_19395 [Mucilaginibacter sp. PAMB04274]|uniref:hypothetical protein n=1 Tax=Mucilaginibacter sp. PAMB04274 TaxID=3138568 RepID=UPI0031F63C5A
MNNQSSPAEAAELFKRRSLGILPHIDIAGTDFTIDWRAKELRESAAPWNTIPLRNLDMGDAGENYLFFYDTAKHTLWHFDPYITALPANVILLEIPYELKLDPYAVANEYGMDPAELIAEFPIQKTLSSAVKPLSESGLPEIIQENLEKLQTRSNDRSPDRKRGR